MHHSQESPIASDVYEILSCTSLRVRFAGDDSPVTCDVMTCDDV